MSSSNVKVLERYAVWDNLINGEGTSTMPGQDHMINIVCDVCSGCGCGCSDDDRLMPEEEDLIIPPIKIPQPTA